MTKQPREHSNTGVYVQWKDGVIGDFISNLGNQAKQEGTYWNGVVFEAIAQEIYATMWGILGDVCSR